VAPAATLCAFDGSFGAGLLEAFTQVKVEGHSVLLVSYDAPYPSPLRETRPVLDAMGIALVLSPTRSARSLAAIELSLSDEPAQTLPWPELEAWRLQIPAGRGLPLLRVLAPLALQAQVGQTGDEAAAAESVRDSADAQASPTRVVLDYLNGRQLAIEVRPCN
jgi:hypothetical protein